MRDPLHEVRESVVFVVGASRGIGRAIAEGFVTRGARVAVAGRQSETITETAAVLSGLRAVGNAVLRPAVPIVCDVSSSEDVSRAVAEVVEKCGEIDTLIQVAGVNRRKPTLELTEEEFDWVVDIDLKGAFLMAREVGRRMVARGRGNQIHVTSLNADRPLTNVVPYAMSKAGMAQMVRALALEWGRFGVRVNGLAPGFILTDLTEKLWSFEPMRSWGEANTPLGRLGRPEDLVGAALFLASPASAFMTGQSIVVDGGFSAGWSWPIPADNQ